MEEPTVDDVPFTDLTVQAALGQFARLFTTATTTLENIIMSQSAEFQRLAEEVRTELADNAALKQLVEDLKASTQAAIDAKDAAIAGQESAVERLNDALAEASRLADELAANNAVTGEQPSEEPEPTDPAEEPETPTDPEPEPTDPTEEPTPIDPEPTDPTEEPAPEPTPTEPPVVEPTDSTEPTPAPQQPTFPF